MAHNRKAYHDYFIEETLEAGLVLVGSEIKSIRAGRVNLRDSYVTFRNGEAWLIGCHIAGYSQASYLDHDPRRDRKLLMNKREILRWRQRAEQKGYTIVPLRLYLRNNLAKVEIALARGKRQYDKREAIAERESQRDIERALKDALR
ncbi:MAG: SsrA-binding protein SmpB [Chloroflexi bacterium]|nr:SsrA-binding protein SmpB [Chloroflexota bacterium]